MDTSLNTAKAFTDAIKKMASEECDRINEETEKIKADRLLSLNDEAESRYDEYVENELSRISASRNRKIAELDEGSKCRLSAIRQELFENVFSEVKQGIIAFTEAAEYRKFMISCVKEIYDNVSDKENVEFFVRKQDMIFKEEINDIIGKFINITACDDIVFGGVKAADKKSGCLFDNTLDAKLEQQKTWFLDNSGLKL